jgi:osmotically-inducible protein OsmY
METGSRIIVLSFLLALTSGCVIVVDEGEGDVDASWATSYSSTEADEELARRIGDAIEDDPRLRNEDLRVAVRRGVVTLRGEVTNLEVLEQAVNVAAAVDGTRRVVSKLEVELPAR